MDLEYFLHLRESGGRNVGSLFGNLRGSLCPEAESVDDLEGCGLPPEKKFGKMNSIHKHQFKGETPFVFNSLVLKNSFAFLDGLWCLVSKNLVSI